MISVRLKSLVKYIDNNDKVIDIGCDHALLDIYLVHNKKLSKMIVSDIHKNALDSGITNIKKYGLEDKIEARLGNGLDVLSSFDQIDTVLISGMGTMTIMNILDNEYVDKIRKLVIQSNRDYDILREKVVNMGFYIESEEVVTERGKIYINIVFLRGQKNYTNIELKYGTTNMINKSLYYNYLISKDKEIINNIHDEENKKRFLEEISFLEKLLKKYPK